MGYVSRLFRKLWKEEKYVRIFLSIFWPTLILWIGCHLLWYAEKRYRPGPIITVKQPETSGSTDLPEVDSILMGNIGKNDSTGVEEEKLLNP